MTNNDHYAVVIGLTKYPQLGDPPPSDLMGPENDADAVKAWLVDPEGGGLPDDEDHVFLIKSSDDWGRSKVGRPRRDDIQDAFRILAEKAEQTRGYFGRRLYVYASGHGFSPFLNQACLHAADASIRTSGTNVFFTAWLELFQEAGYFRECVLWLDCCMNRDRSDPSLPTLQGKPSGDPPGPTFVAFSARRPLKAVERPSGPHGEVHGVFTTVLLEGLRGAAVNPYGMVTGRSLADWLRNAQRARIDGPDRDDVKVSKEPEIIREDQDLVFARGLKARTYDVTLQFPPAAAGKQARLWSGRPPLPQEFTVAPDGRRVEALAPAMYVVDAPDPGLRVGFEVTSDLTIQVDQSGPAVVPTEELVDLNIPADPGAEIFIVDEAFRLVDRAVDQLTARLPYGLYKVRVRSGRRMAEEIRILDAHVAPAAEAEAPAMAMAPFSSAAPLPHTAATHEYHDAAARAARGRLDVRAGAGGELVVMVRQWRQDDRTPSGFEPWTGVRVADASGRTVADLAKDGQRASQRDPWATVSVEIDPGVYFLRIPRAGGGEHEQSLVVSRGWRTEAFVMRAPVLEEMRDSAHLRISILTNLLGQPGDDRTNEQVDHARVALADERLVLGGMLDDLLLDNFTTPVAGILGAHLLLVEHARRPSSRILKLDEIVPKLRAMTGHDHPDVEALSLRCSDKKLRNRQAPAGPPMFEASWRLLVEESAAHPALIPIELWKRVHALWPAPPFMAWAADRRTKQTSLAHLAENLGLEPAPQARAVAFAAARPSLGAAPGRGPGRAARAPKRAGPSRRAVAARLKQLGVPAAALDTL